MAIVTVLQERKTEKERKSSPEGLGKYTITDIQVVSMLAIPAGLLSFLPTPFYDLPV